MKKSRFLRCFSCSLIIIGAFLFLSGLISAQDTSSGLKALKYSVKRTKYTSERGLEKRLAKYHRLPFAHTPTPFERMEILSYKLKGPKIFIKRDDQTGLAFGGNKARKLEYIMADVLRKKADVVITWAGLQSNWCRQTAAAARMWGIRPILVLFKEKQTPVIYDGNLLIDTVVDADVRIVSAGDLKNIDSESILDDIEKEEKAKGHHPYTIPIGGSRTGRSMEDPLGAISYANAFLEIYRDAKRVKTDIDYVILATGSGGTQAGLVVGAKALGGKTRIIGISVSASSEKIQKNVANIANETAQALDLDIVFSPDEIIVFDEYTKEGYGVLTPAIAEAIQLAGQSEGIILDPVYTGKSLAGMVDLIKKGILKKNMNIVFLHTGGTPGLFVYKDKLVRSWKEEYLEINPVVLVSTELGVFKIELYIEKAPITVKNFLKYVDAGLFNGSSFYRTVNPENDLLKEIKISVIQGGIGGFEDKQIFPPIEHETTQQSGVLHKDGVISMARNEPGSAASEFFVCIGDQPELDYGGFRNPDRQGFAAFGRVIEGMDVVRKIHSQPAEGQSLKPRIKIFSIIEIE